MSEEPYIMPERCCDAWESSATGRATRALTVAGFEAVWNGRARRPEDLVPDQADAAVARAEALASMGCCELDAQGRLVGVHGLTLRSTRHRFVHAGTARYTWCAFDAVGIPAALGVDAIVETSCRHCGRVLEVEVIKGEPPGTGPVLWLPPAVSSNLLGEFCAHADMYCSAAHVEAQIDMAPAQGRVVKLREAAALGRSAWADVRPSQPGDSPFDRSGLR